MNVHIRDSAALNRITPSLLSRYLKVHGWAYEETWRGRIAVWSNVYGEERQQILVPLMDSSDTYAVRMSEAVSTLADVEGRSQLEVYDELVEDSAEVVESANAERQLPG